MVGDIDFLEYKQGNNLLGVGAVFSTLGGVSLTLGGIGFGIDDTKEYTRVCGILIVSGLAGLAIGLPFILPGAKKMEGVAKRFNQNHGVHSLNLSPTLMPLEIPQEDNSYALGLSLNMKF